MITREPRDAARTVLILGFAAMLALMVLLGAHGLSRMAAVQERLSAIGELHNVKTALIGEMRMAARERTVALQQMLLVADPFLRDDEWMRFNENGARFVAARDRLQDMDLSEEEEFFLARQGRLTAVAAAGQHEAAQLIFAGDADAAVALLVEQLLPTQQAVFEELTRLLGYQTQASARAVTEAAADYRRARLLTIGMGAATLLLGLFIALVVIRTITRAEARVHREKERALVTLRSIGDGVITTDALGRIEYLNPVAEEFTGHRMAGARGRPLLAVFRIVDETTRTALPSPIEEALAQDTIVASPGAVLLRREDGVEFSIEYTASPIFDQQQRSLGTVLVFRNVSDARSLARQLSYQARHDALTGLYNRHEFEHRLREALTTARTARRRHALCYLDLDQFRVVNDTCGHTAGDELLKQLAGHFKTKIRSGDIVARLGGDEFGVLLEDCGLDGARSVAANLHRTVSDFRFVWENRSFQVGVSIGVVGIGADAGTLADVLRRADAARYVAKDQGRNRIHVVSEDRDAALVKRQGEMEWMHRIKEALQHDRFCLYAQAIVPLGRAREGGGHHELLLRLRDPDGTIVPPMAFIPAAERYNLMPAIDRWVIQRACAALRAMPDSGRFAINLSGQSLCEDDLLGFILQALRDTGVDPSRICFEITETSAITNLSQASQLIATLRDHGCRFALDDFGCGLSSFAYLKNLPVDYLKIDGSFVREMANDPMDRVLVEYINDIGHVMGIETIAEFVENETTAAILAAMGVDHGQGYGIARPIPLEALPDSAPARASMLTAALPR